MTKSGLWRRWPVILRERGGEEILLQFWGATGKLMAVTENTRLWEWALKEISPGFRPWEKGYIFLSSLKDLGWQSSCHLEHSWPLCQKEQSALKTLKTAIKCSDLFHFLQLVCQKYSHGLSQLKRAGKMQSDHGSDCGELEIPGKSWWKYK